MSSGLVHLWLGRNTGEETLPLAGEPSFSVGMGNMVPHYMTSLLVARKGGGPFKSTPHCFEVIVWYLDERFLYS